MRSTYRPFTVCVLACLSPLQAHLLKEFEKSYKKLIADFVLRPTNRIFLAEINDRVSDASRGHERDCGIVRDARDSGRETVR